MSLSSLWRLLAVALPVLAALVAPLSAVDLAYHLRAGAGILATGAIPATDTWTSTAAGLAWFDQQWGAQVALAAVDAVGGWTGLVLLRGVLTGLAFGGLLAAVAAAGLAPRRAALLVLAAFALASPALALRPQLFGVALFGGVLALLALRRAHPRLVLLVPLLAAAWANLHGSFPLAVATAGWAALDDLAARAPGRRRSLAVLAATAAATCLTPWGAGAWGYAAGLAGNGVLAARVTEWQPPSPADPVGLAALASVGLAILLVVVAARRGRAPAPAALLFAAGLAVLLLRAVRGLAWWPLGAAAVLAPLLVPAAPGAPPRPTPRGVARANLAVAGLLVAAGVAALPAWRPLDAAGVPAGLLRDAPPGVTATLRRLARPGDRLWHPQPWGSWFAFAVPAATVFLDSRIELFPPDAWADHDTLAAGGPGWEAVLARRGITLVAATREDDALVPRLAGLGWTVAYRGEDGMVFVAPDREPAAD